MSALSDAGSSPAAELAGLEPLTTIRSRWPVLIGAGLTVLMILGLGRELLDSGLAGLGRAVPRSPWFFVTFAGTYMVPQTFDYLIFRRLWRIPPAGLVALIKKRIANEVLIGYSGEAYFYAWARARAKMVAAPFGAVKDVSILSAMAGNALTLLMVAVALPLGHALLTPNGLRMVEVGAAVSVAMTLPFLIFSRKVFSLPRRDLWWTFGMHCARIVTGSVLVALAWHFGMPDVSVAMWLFLSAGRLLVSRLPLVPNKDLLFANFAILLIGQDKALADLIAFTAAATLLVHVVLLAGFSLHHLARRAR